MTICGHPDYTKPEGPCEGCQWSLNGSTRLTTHRECPMHGHPVEVNRVRQMRNEEPGDVLIDAMRWELLELRARIQYLEGEDQFLMQGTKRVTRT